MFKEQQPSYTELSDRAMKRWAEASGMRCKQSGGSLDKPEFHFGVHSLDSFKFRRLLQAVASTRARNFVVMEVKNNLVKEDRAASVARLRGSLHKHVACVVMGEP